MALGARLNILRVKKGESLQEAADELGVSKTYLWQLEKGRTENPTIDLLKRISNHYDVTISYIVGENSESFQDDKMARMFREASELSEPDLNFLDDMIKSLRERMKDDTKD